jgi:hypothetical protein
MYCNDCGIKIDEGELVCKGCGKLTATIRDELLALTEKTADMKCPSCGGFVKTNHPYCSGCGEPVPC